jgi:hypothetical protein
MFNHFFKFINVIFKRYIEIIFKKIVIKGALLALINVNALIGLLIIPYNINVSLLLSFC